MQWARLVIGATLLCLAALQAPAATLSFPERGRSAVVDAAGVIPGDAEASLNARIVEWNRATGHQLAVATVPSLQGREIQEYGFQLLRHWRLGRAGANDGVILLLAPNERQVRIEVGYGLEPVLTDAMSSRIIRESIRPALRAGDVAGALTAGAERIMASATMDRADAQALTVAAERATRRSGPSLWLILLIGIPALLVAGAIAILNYDAREQRKWRQRQTEREKDAPRRERQKRARLTKRWARLREEGKTPFDTFEDFYADHVERQEKREREKTGRWIEERRAEEKRRASSRRSSHSPSWSSSGDSGLGGGSSSYDPGFDSGGGSGGGGGADSNY